jgi:glycosyltransferase 2 family protein
MSKPQAETAKDNSSDSAKHRSRFYFHWSSFLRLVLSLGLLGFVIYLADLEEFLAAVAGLSVIYLAIFALLVYIDRALVVYKWNLLLVARNVHVPFLHLFWLYSTALLAGIVLPTTIGGDMFRVYDLKKCNVSAKISIASIIVERVLGFICMLAIAILGLGISLYLMGNNWTKLFGVTWAIAIGVLMCAGFLFIIRNEYFNAQLDKFSKKYGQYSIISKIHNVFQYCRDYRNDVAVLLKVTGFTLIRQCIPILMNILLVYAYDIQASFLELCAIIPLIVLGSRLPISMDGIGIQEGLYVVLFGLVGVSASQALLMSITFRAMAMLCTLPFGIIYLINGRSVSKLNSKPIT